MPITTIQLTHLQLRMLPGNHYILLLPQITPAAQQCAARYSDEAHISTSVLCTSAYAAGYLLPHCRYCTHPRIYARPHATYPKKVCSEMTPWQVRTVSPVSKHVAWKTTPKLPLPTTRSVEKLMVCRFTPVPPEAWMMWPQALGSPRTTLPSKTCSCSKPRTRHGCE